MKTTTLLNIILTVALAIAVIFIIMNEKSISPEKLKLNMAIENIMTRKSVRSYTGQPVGDEQIDILMRAAMSAPSAMDRRPWKFVVVTERASLDTLAQKLPYAKMALNAPAAIVVCGDMTKAGMVGDEPYWIQDCSAASENLLLAANAIGLGAVWTGVYPYQDRMDAVRNVLELPEHIVPLNFIPIGYPSEEGVAKDKYDAENIRRNRW